MSDSLLIRAASVDDAVLLSYLSTVTFYETYEQSTPSRILSDYVELYFSERIILKEIVSQSSRYFIAFEKDEPAGYVKIGSSVQPVKIENHLNFEVERIYILQQFQGKGIGKKLLDLCEQTAADEKIPLIWLSVWIENKRAVEFYKRCGFEIFDTVDFYLMDQVYDDYLMKKVIG